MYDSIGVISMSRKAPYTFEETHTIFSMPFMDLLYRAHTVHKKHFPHNTIQASSLLSVKTGKCPEDCSYCAQSSRYGSIESSSVDVEEITRCAMRAKEQGATRFCMGASGRSPSDDDIAMVCKAIALVKELGMECCVTLGMLTDEAIDALAHAGLDYYNHNVDTSPAFYTSVITTRTLEERLSTIRRVQEAGIRVCSGGIIGIGENNKDRIEMITMLANLPIPPESVPINKLVPIPNTPLQNAPEVDSFDFIRTIALARIVMPTSYIRLSAGRSSMEDTMQALCFFAGANSIFIGDMLLTTSNISVESDKALLSRLDLVLEE